MAIDSSQEINFDGLVGPTHHFGGYAYGNIASMKHQKQISHPKTAALEGLAKMKHLHDLGIPQALLPPRMRPSLPVLRKLGFEGDDKTVFHQAAQKSPALFLQLSSSASMWAANCATTTPSCDAEDGKFHLTVANLQSQFHRSIEAEESYRLFNLLFPDKSLFSIHPPLPQGGDFGDEGAANHTRFCQEYGSEGFHLFVYAKSAFERKAHRFPFRQAKEASEAVARIHRIGKHKSLFVRQNPDVIEEGVFHNDVISVGNKNRFLYHEKAFLESKELLSTIQKECPLDTLCIKESMLSVKKAVTTYFFNGQLLSLPSGEDYLLLPNECLDLNLNWLPYRVGFVDLTESMNNGGGPACLRLRVVLNEKERKHLHPYILFTDLLYQRLVGWVERYYRDRLSLSDLTDFSLFQENQEALETLTQILHLGTFYEFQQTASSRS